MNDILNFLLLQLVLTLFLPSYLIFFIDESTPNYESKLFATAGWICVGEQSN